jgi:hypothetical protein
MQASSRSSTIASIIPLATRTLVTFLFVAVHAVPMSEKAARRFEETRNKGDADISEPPAPPEPIYDLTTGNDKDTVKAATARERGEKP